MYGPSPSLGGAEVGEKALLSSEPLPYTTHMTISITLPKWFDLHVHLRQDELLHPIITDHLAAGCAGVLAMPNTKPPVAKVLKNDALSYMSIEDYHQQILTNGGDRFQEIIIPLYLTKDTTAAMITAGTQQGVLKACKYYPPHGTTGAEYSAPIDYFIQNGVLKAMQDNGIILCVHGETAYLEPTEYFARHTNAEEHFYQHTMPILREKFPTLKIVCEHITTKIAADFIKAHPASITVATVTPQHLLYTIGDLVKGLKYHLYCLPLLKFDEDRASLRAAVTDAQNQQFFAGTDSAPHTQKTTECGCAAGCYTAPIGAQLYAEAFELAGLNLSLVNHQTIFRKFLCELGPRFYNLAISKETFTLIKLSQKLQTTQTPKGTLTPLSLGLDSTATMNWQIKKL